MKRHLRSGLFILLGFAAVCPAIAGPIDYLPYTNNFESYTNGTPLIDGTNGWYSNIGWPPSYAVAEVQGDIFYEGTKAAMIPELAVVLSNRFESMTVTTLWTRLYLRPLFYDGEVLPMVDTNSSAMFYINTNGYFMVHDGPPDPATNWVEVTNAVGGADAPQLTEGDWAKVFVFQNFERQEWALFLTNNLLMANIGFVGDVPAFNGFDIYNGAGTSYLDYVSVSITTPDEIAGGWVPVLDVDTASIEQTEFAGRAAAAQGYVLRRASGTIPMPFTNIVTVSAGSWLSVDVSSGVNTGQPQPVAVSYASSVLAPGAHYGNIRVESYDTLFMLEAVNSPHDIPVTLNMMDMQVAPQVMAFSNSVGNTAESRQFTVVNGGAGVMTYSLIENAGWINLSSYGGSSAGPAQVNAVTASFSTAHLPSGVYLTNVLVASDVASGWTSTVSVAMTICSQALLARTPGQIMRSISKGDSIAPTNFLVWNSSAAPRPAMSYTVASDADWLSVNPSGGVSTGEVDSVQVFFDVSGLDVGTHNGTITITGYDMVRDAEALNSAQRIDVVVTVLLPAAPAWVSASDGTHANMVYVAWAPSPDAANYQVWRSATSDIGQAVMVAALAGTNYNDVAVPPGVMYWYWLKSVNQHGAVGLPGSSDSGWRALSAPTGVWASAGQYEEKIVVGWNAVAGAGGYELWRGENSDDPAAAVKIADITSTGYEDTDCKPEILYYYRVKAKCSLGAGAFSASACGWRRVSAVPDAPSWISATDGDYTDRVRITWPVSSLASRYEVWRSAEKSSDTAVRIAQTVNAIYDDMSVTPGVSYYFWVKAGNTNGMSQFSPADSGYAAAVPGPAGEADLAVSSLVLLTRTLAPMSSPALVSMRLINHGPQDMSGGNDRVVMDFYISRDSSFAASGRWWIGDCVFDLDMAAGDDILFKFTDGMLANVAIPWFASGEYYIFAVIRHYPPSGLHDPDMSNNIVMRLGTIQVSNVAPAYYHVPNDYAGVKRSDLAVYDTNSGCWYAIAVDGTILAWAVPWGGPGFMPVPGDYNGDAIADLAVYGPYWGAWFIATKDGSPILWGESWGGGDFTPVAGDFFGDGLFDLAVYTASTGQWFIRSIDGSRVSWGLPWGGTGMAPVAGDYSGNGISDLAVYTGRGDWYVRPAGEAKVLAWAKNWGAPGMTPVHGDYDGDGVADMAVYHGAGGLWFVRAMSGELIAWAVSWGAPGMVPVPGDYDGDGIYDFAVYEEATGKWYVWSLSRGALVWGAPWGGSGFMPVGAAY